MQLAVNGSAGIPSIALPLSRTEDLVRLIAASQKPLFAYIRTLLGPTNEVDDVLQEVNLVLWRRGHEFDRRCQFLTWACHIAYLQVLAQCKRRQREKHVYFDESVLADVAERIAQKVEDAVARLEVLRGCLAKLPESQRRIIVRRYEDGGSVQDVASELDRPVGSVRVTLRRIRKLLSDCIARTLAEGEDP
jgi:RNA polymerase sigma-70 factor, ECF subfamily